KADKITPAMAPHDMKPSPALSLLKKANPTLQGRKIGVLVSDGIDGAIVDQLRKTVEKAGAKLMVIAPKIGGVKTKQGHLAADHALSAGPSILFDAVVLCLSEAGAKQLANEAGAKDWLANAFNHLKIIGFTREAMPLFKAANVDAAADEGMVGFDGKSGIDGFINTAKQQRIWAREPKLRSPG
ncbi:MAG: catalase HPII, partial [Rhodospirillales bacterium]